MSFWNWYASVNDSVRHAVVEQGWYGRQVTPDISAQDLAPSETEKEPEPERHFELYDQTWGPEPDQAELYGDASLSAPQNEVATPTAEPEIVEPSLPEQSI
ncbi:hypothetical protein [Maricaulis sp.]|uniref:hypothetical protein n=1 Tax=Maricaulis sp. TaxID=1486257 RepID=UPI002617C70B|nr:hypothetical protein [Maricaulis sp.]